MKTPRVSQVLAVLGPAMLLSALGVYLFSEARWVRLNSPVGKFTTVGEYLAWGRLPDRVEVCQLASGTYYVAYSPLHDRGIALPSGPAAYVFNDQGALVDWTADIGDSSNFSYRWPSKACEPATLEQLRQLVADRGDDHVAD